MLPLSPVIQEYAWGSRSALADLLGKPSPSEKPQAELWLGAHPLAPAGIGGCTLIEHIAKDPLFALGAEVSERFGNRLPFLLKVLAVDAPLSLQVHPSIEQARAGFAREEAAGIALKDPKRSYKDTSHKPEMVVALTRFEALCGFRTPEQMHDRLQTLNVPDLRSTVQMLEGWPNEVGVNGVVHGLLGMSEPERLDVMAKVTKALARVKDEGDEFARAHALAQRYPLDTGALISLLLNPITLEPGQALFLPAGNLHAYLKGLAVEVMAASDNVLRGGLTEKHVDVAELLATLQYDLGPVRVLSPRREAEEEVWEAPVSEFRLSRLRLKHHAAVPPRRGPEILLCVEGTAQVNGQGLARGGALWVDAGDAPYTVTGDGVVFRATAGVGAAARTSR